MSDLDILINEVARIALQNNAMTDHVSKLLDIDPNELQKLSAYLEQTLNDNYGV